MLIEITPIQYHALRSILQQYESANGGKHKVVTPKYTAMDIKAIALDKLKSAYPSIIPYLNKK